MAAAFAVIAEVLLVRRSGSGLYRHKHHGQAAVDLLKVHLWSGVPVRPLEIALGEQTGSGDSGEGALRLRGSS